MTQRLPIPGQDDGTWGDILNDFLEVSLNTDGTLIPSALTTAGAELISHKGVASGYASLNTSALVPTTQLGTGTASSATYLRGDNTWATVPGGATNATTSAPGLIQLSGDFSNTSTATAPVVSTSNGVPIVTTTGTQTLTNKSIAGSQITSAVATATSAVSATTATTVTTIPALTGDVTSSGSSNVTTVAKLQGTTLSAPTGGATSYLNATGAWSTPTATGAQALVPTSVKTAAYTAAPGDFIPVDASSASVTITLPTAPTDKTRVEIKMIATSGSNTVTFNTGGSDVLNKASGVTTGTLSLLNQAIMLQYAATGSIWYVQSDDLPLTQLDARYPQSGGYVSPAAKTTTGAAAVASYLNVMDYGAVGDGSTDDTTAFTNALSAAASGYLDLYVPKPASQYKLTGQLTWQANRHSVNVSGGATLNWSTATFNGPAISAQGWNYSGDTNHNTNTNEWKGGLLIGPNTDSGTVDGLYLVDNNVYGAGLQGTPFRNIKLYGFRDGLQTDHGSYLNQFVNLWIHNSHRYGWNHLGGNDVGENYSWHGGCIAGTHNSSQTGTAIYIPGGDADIYLYGLSLDYNDIEFNVTAGQLRFFGCHLENNNTANPMGIISQTSGSGNTYVFFSGTNIAPTDSNSSTLAGAGASTTVASGSNGSTLPQSTISVASTTGFPSSGTLNVVTGSGTQAVIYTNTTSTTFTGCTGGTGTMSTGGAVTSTRAFLFHVPSTSNGTPVVDFQGAVFDTYGLTTHAVQDDSGLALVRIQGGDLQMTSSTTPYSSGAAGMVGNGGPTASDLGQPLSSIYNGNFELSTSVTASFQGWLVAGFGSDTAVIDTTNPRSGTHSFHSVTSSSSSPNISQKFPVRPGQRLKAIMWIAVSAYTSGNIIPHIGWYASDNATRLVAVNGPTIAATQIYTPYYFDLTVPTAVCFGDIYVASSSMVATWFIDDVAVALL